MKELKQKVNPWKDQNENGINKKTVLGKEKDDLGYLSLLYRFLLICCFSPTCPPAPSDMKRFGFCSLCSFPFPLLPMHVYSSLTNWKKNEEKPYAGPEVKMISEYRFRNTNVKGV